MATRIERWHHSGLIKYQAKYWEMGGDGHFDQNLYDRILEVKKNLKQKTLNFLNRPMKKETGPVRTLDDTFSKFIRLRDADVHGMVTCVSCGTRIAWKDSVCCHYANRQHYATRWDEVNNHAGCYYCNCFDKGYHLHEYRKFLDDRYGPGTSEDIMIRSRVEKTYSDEELRELITHYKLKIKEYEKN